MCSTRLLTHGQRILYLTPEESKTSVCCHQHLILLACLMSHVSIYTYTPSFLILMPHFPEPTRDEALKYTGLVLLKLG